MKELISVYEKVKRDSLRKAIIRCLDRILRQMEVRGEKSPTETLMWTEVKKTDKDVTIVQKGQKMEQQRRPSRGSNVFTNYYSY